MIYRFDEFELDTRLFELRRRGIACPMEPQVFDVLSYLVQHHDRVVPKTELIEHIWPDKFISEAALTTRLMTARKVLGDTGREQRYIRTLHGRGYRFVGNVTEEAEPATPASTGAPAASPEASPAEPAVARAAAAIAPDALLGRERELGDLAGAWAAALSGRRQLLFVTGEPGIGKTTLVRAFLDHLDGNDSPCVAVGQCIEYRGAAEPYMPVLEALGRLCREDAAGEFVAILSRHAPTWLVQLPWLVGEAELQKLQLRVLGSTRERMLREMVEAIEAMSAVRPIVLVLEDLHWSDYATVDLLSAVARRQEPARLLILGTYRPADVRAAGHPLDALQHELRVRALCQQVALPFLSEQAVREHLSHRFGDAPFVDALAETVFARSEGNPLFVNIILDGWADEAVLTRDGGGWTLTVSPEELPARLPGTLHQTIEHQVGRLADSERALLEAAAVAGAEFAVAAIASPAAGALDDAEASLETIARRTHFLAASGTAEWEDGTVSSVYTFTHGLYPEVLYERLSPARRALLHQRIGERLEAGYGARAAEHAAELALHFVRGREVPRAVQYLEAAAAAAMARGAHREASGQFQEALDLLAAKRDTFEDADAREAMLQYMLGSAKLLAYGFGSSDAEQALVRAMECASRASALSRFPAAAFQLAALYEYRGRHADAGRLLADIDARGMLEEQPLRVMHHALMSCSTFHQGQFQQSVKFGDEGAAAATNDMFDQSHALLGEDPGLGCREWSSLALWFLGYPDQALTRVLSLVEEARDPRRQYALASALTHLARVRQLRREPAGAREASEVTVEIGTRLGFGYHTAVGRMVRGWALAVEGAHDEGIAEIQRGLRAHETSGAKLNRPYFLGLLADAFGRAGRPADALAVTDDALRMIADQPFFFEGELRRMRGELLLRADPSRASEAEQEMRVALAIAGEQQARSIELRAAMGLAMLLRDRGEAEEARELLAPVVAWFTEGLDTEDLRRARAMLDEPAPVRRGARRRR